jgi:hypothetical protein
LAVSLTYALAGWIGLWLAQPAMNESGIQFIFLSSGGREWLDTLYFSTWLLLIIFVYPRLYFHATSRYIEFRERATQSRVLLPRVVLRLGALAFLTWWALRWLIPGVLQA